jgi:hypothetical protein
MKKDDNIDELENQLQIEPEYYDEFGRNVTEKVTGRGGSRKGAGRPVGTKVSAKTIKLIRWVTPDEKVKILDYLARLRAERG